VGLTFLETHRDLRNASTNGHIEDESEKVPRRQVVGRLGSSKRPSLLEIYAASLEATRMNKL
jgi:hypothetical protein